MRACMNCRHGDRATDPTGAEFYWCRLAPPKPIVLSGEKGQDVVHVIPSMKPSGWCGQFKLSWFRWLGSFGRRGT